MPYKPVRASSARAWFSPPMKLTTIAARSAMGLAASVLASGLGCSRAESQSPGSASGPPSATMVAGDERASPVESSAVATSRPTALITPTSVTAAATSPFAVRVAWVGGPGRAVGHAIEVEMNGKFILASVVAAAEGDYEHHHRLPGRSYSYRVRTFDEKGVSPPSPVARVTTPERSAPVIDKKYPSACTRLPPATDPSKLAGRPRQVHKGPGGKPVHDDPEPTNAFRRRFFGEYQGCMRELGVFELQADVSVVEGFEDEGFPLLRAIAGAGQEGAQILTLRFERGRYRVVDEALFCGERSDSPSGANLGSEGDLTGFTPPFARCQRDLDPR